MENKKIAIITPNRPDYQGLFRIGLPRIGAYDAYICDGKESSSFVNQCRAQKVEAIILDYTYYGNLVVPALRAAPELKNIPIIVMLYDFDDWERVRSEGATAYISGKVNLDEVKQVLDLLCPT